MGKDKTGAQVEGEGIPTTTLTWRGRDLTIPATIEDCDLEVLEAFESQRASTWARLILGDEQYQALKPMTVRDFADLGEQLAVALGFVSAGK